MVDNTTPTGYHDRFDRDKKNWKKVLFNPGKALQAAELNEIQSIIHSEAQQIGLALFSEGGILSGCDIIVNADKDRADISAGQIYALGYVHDIPSSVVSIDGVGDEIIGVIISPKVITEDLDGELRDVALGYETYQYAGAHRLTYEYQYVSYNITNSSGDANALNSIKIVELKDGEVSQTFKQLRPALDSVLKLLAERTYDESGHYVVNKFNISIQDRPSTVENSSTHMDLIVRDGRGYVSGYKVENTSRIVPIERPLTTLPRIDEPEKYLTGTLEYRVDNSPILDVINITATVESPEFSVIRGAVGGGLDQIPVEYQPVVDIKTITSSANPSGFVKGTDFTQNGNYIDWSLGGNEPDPGETYYVVVEHIKQLTKTIYTSTSQTSTQVVSGNTLAIAGNVIHKVNTITYGSQVYVRGIDFEENFDINGITWLSPAPANGASVTIDFNNWTQTVSGDYVARDSFRSASGDSLFDEVPPKTILSGNSIDYRSYISFDAPGVTPVNNSLFYVDYNYILPRSDILTIDKHGYISLISGEPAVSPVLPPSSPNLMKLVKIELPAESTAADAIITSYDNQRLTFVDLQALLSQVKDIQYNMASVDLDDESVDLPTPSDKLGIFTDSYTNFDKIDAGNVDTDVTLDVLGRTCGLPTTSEVHTVDPTSISNISSKQDYYLLPYEEKPLSLQQFSTGILNINPNGIDNLEPIVILSPRLDTLSKSGVTIIGPNKSVHIGTDQIANRKFITQYGPDNSFKIGDEILGRGGINRLVPRKEWITQVENQRNGTINRIAVENSIEATSRDAISLNRIISNLQIREQSNADPKIITVYGKRFRPQEDNISIRIDGKPATLTPAGTTLPGTNTGTVKANTTGEWEATFTIPDGIKTGTNEVQTESTGTIPTYIQFSGSLSPEAFKINGNFPALVSGQLSRIHTSLDSSNATTGIFAGSSWNVRFKCRWISGAVGAIPVGSSRSIEDPYWGAIRLQNVGGVLYSLIYYRRVGNSMKTKTFNSAFTIPENTEPATWPLIQIMASNIDSPTLTLIVNGSITKSTTWDDGTSFTAESLSMPVFDLIGGSVLSGSGNSAWSGTSLVSFIGMDYHVTGEFDADRLIFDGITYNSGTESISGINSSYTATRLGAGASVSSGTIPDKSNVATTNFFSGGMNTQIADKVTYSRNRLPTSDGIIDPIAQTFSVEKSTYLTSIDLFFETAGAGEVDILLVETNNGIPTTTVLGEVTKLNTDINIDGTLTKFTFESPIYVESGKEYAFILKTDSTNCNVQIATVGKQDPKNGWVTSNPEAGSLFRSENLKTWSVIQNTSLKFIVNRTLFTSTYETVLLDPITSLNPISKFELDSTFSEPTKDTLCKWQYSIDQNNWHDYVPPMEVDLNTSVTTLYLRFILKGTDTVSPIVLMDMDAELYGYKNSGSYIGRQFVLPEENARYVDVYIDTYLPTGTTIDVLVNFNDGSGWQSMTYLSNEDRPIDQQWIERHYQFDTGVTPKQYIQIRVDMQGSNEVTTPLLRRLRAITSAI